MVKLWVHGSNDELVLKSTGLIQLMVPSIVDRAVETASLMTVFGWGR